MVTVEQAIKGLELLSKMLNGDNVLWGNGWCRPWNQNKLVPVEIAKGQIKELALADKT